MPKSSKVWAETAWKKAYDGVLARPTFAADGSIISNDANAIQDDLRDMHIDGETCFSEADSKLQLHFPPKQSVLAKIKQLILKMHDPKTGVKTHTQNFRGITTGNCNCPAKDDCASLGVGGAFTPQALMDWLTENLNIQTPKEAYHAAEMLCKVGFIIPCNISWSMTTLKLEETEGMVLRFQSPYYWPTETLTTSETDHACYLVGRQNNPHGIQMDEFEVKYLAKIQQPLSHQWEFIEKTAALKERFVLVEKPIQNIGSCFPVTNKPEFSYWRVNRPQSYCKSTKTTNLADWPKNLRGLNRKYCSYAELEKFQVKKEKKKTGKQSPTKVLMASCSRVLSNCTDMEDADPFLTKDETYKNHWRTESTGNSWPLPATQETGPYKMQCKIWGLNFDAMLRDELGQWLFEQHLKKEYSVENLAFYRACVVLRGAPVAEVENMLRKIFDEFISPNSNTPINIDTQTFNQVRQEIKRSKTRFTFDIALDHIYTLMRKDSYKRFLNSNIYKEAVENAVNPTIVKEKKRTRLFGLVFFT